MTLNQISTACHHLALKRYEIETYSVSQTMC